MSPGFNSTTTTSYFHPNKRISLSLKVVCRSPSSHERPKFLTQGCSVSIETSSPVILVELLGNLLQLLHQHVLLFCLYVRHMLWVLSLRLMNPKHFLKKKKFPYFSGTSQEEGELGPCSELGFS